MSIFPRPLGLRCSFSTEASSAEMGAKAARAAIFLTSLACAGLLATSTARGQRSAVWYYCELFAYLLPLRQQLLAPWRPVVPNADVASTSNTRAGLLAPRCSSYPTPLRHRLHLLPNPRRHLRHPLPSRPMPFSKGRQTAKVGKPVGKPDG